MNNTNEPRPGRLSALERCVTVALAVTLLSLLVVALVLEPSPRGHGTHQGLGLPPCTSIVVFGCRCPACGMTTSWANLIRGRVVAAVSANVGGALLCGAAMAAVPWMLVSVGRGRWIVWIPTNGVIAVAGVVVSVIIVIDWIVRLTCGL